MYQIVLQVSNILIYRAYLNRCLDVQMCVGLNIYIDDHLMFTELSSRERVSVCENMHLGDNLHFTDSRRRTSMYLLGVNHLLRGGSGQFTKTRTRSKAGRPSKKVVPVRTIQTLLLCLLEGMRIIELQYLARQLQRGLCRKHLILQNIISEE